MKEELGSEATVYLSVISAVASGATRQSEIADRAGVSPSSSAGKYLSQLRRLHILDHIRPARAPESARSRYPGTRRTREGEIELVAYEGRDLVLAGEAKWQNGLVHTDALAQLEGTVRHVPGYAPATRLVLYSREGFTPELVRRAQASGVILRTVDDLYA